MNLANEIIEKHKEWYDYLGSISKDELSKLSRKELSELVNQINDIPVRYLSSDIREIIKQKKFEEYPALLGVHHYPELKEIDFLSEEKKIDLDKWIAERRAHAGFAIPYSFSPDQKLHDKIYNFLIEKEIIIREVHLKCHCGSWLSRAFHEKYKEQWIADLKESNKEWEEVGLLEKDEFKYFGYCEDCDGNEEYMLGSLKEEFFKSQLHFGGFYTRIKERDKSLDNV